MSFFPVRRLFDLDSKEAEGQAGSDVASQESGGLGDLAGLTLGNTLQPPNFQAFDDTLLDFGKDEEDMADPSAMEDLPMLTRKYPFQ